MAQKAKTYAVSALRALTYRIASTPTVHLPRCAAQLAASIWTCREILSTSVDALKQDGETAVIVHRFKTQLSTLLQDRTVEGRWSAIVLVKAAIEAGGVEILSKSNTWVRNMLGILKKPDPSSTRCLAMLTLTRVFMLTWDYSNLIREITTPALPTFISACLNNAENPRCSSDELQVILEAFETLIAHHPTIFRSNESALRALLTRIVSSTSANTDHHCFSPQHVVTAQRLLVLLSFCAPKQGGAEKWDESLQNAIKAAHQTCDIIFAPVVEHWKSNIDSFRDHAAPKQTSTQLEQEQVDSFGLGPWSGAFAGAERLIALLDQIKSHVETASPAPVSLRIGMILDLASRLLLVTVPTNKQHTLQANPHMAASARDTLFTTLPAIHQHTFQLLEAMWERLGAVMIPTLPTTLEAINAVFAVESFDVQLRAAIYSLVRVLFYRAGPALNKDEITESTGVMVACCNDLLPDSRLKSQTLEQSSTKQATGDLVLQMSKTQSTARTALQASHVQASELLPILLSRLDATKVPRRIRTQIDRTAILTEHKQALLASVLNPPPSPSGHGLQSSLLPLLARLFPDEPEVEALLRPRMPSVITNRSRSLDDDPYKPTDEDDVSMDVDDNEPETQLLDEVPTPRISEERSLDQSTMIQTNSTNLDSSIPPGKHTLDHDTEDVDSKRPRQGTASSQIRSEWQSALTEEAQSAIRSVATPTTNLPGVVVAADATTAGVDDDESDFELPPLTMDQDNEDESE